jgi:hexosaminidase
MGTVAFPRAMGIALVAFAAAAFASGATPVNVIPAPVRIEAGAGAFALGEGTGIVAAKGVAEDVAGQLQGMLQPATGYRLPISSRAGKAPSIRIQIDPGLASLGPEGYRLAAKPDGVEILASAREGLYYGAQTLRQLLPPEIFSTGKVQGVSWTIPAVSIEDSPRFGWRGLHLDVARHFFDAAFVKRYIDLMAIHKLNTFHWHLTDSQGWRIEIKKYPKLTEIGAWRTGDRDVWDYHGFQYGKREGEKVHGGFYTQEQIREIVEYARQRNVRIVPEIEMPGHSWCALLAYPEFSCFPDRKANEATPYCPGKEATYTFLQDVLDETMALFPFEFIHIGGDEVRRSDWKSCPDCQKRMADEGLKDVAALQSYLTGRMTKYIASKGRRAIGWDEILDGGLAEGAAVMSWRGTGGGVSAARQGHDAVMSPVGPLYLDALQGPAKDEPRTIGYAPNTLRQVYRYEPVPSALPADQAKHILGAQGNVWTEWMFDNARVEYMAYPRACALAEVAWTPAARKDYEDFRARLDIHIARLAKLGVNFRFPKPEEKPAGSWASGQTSPEWAVKTWDVTAAVTQAGPHKVTFQYSGGGHRLDMRKVELLAGAAVVASDDHEGRTGSSDDRNVYGFNVPALVPGATYTLRAEVRSDGGSDSNGDIFIRRE